MVPTPCICRHLLRMRSFAGNFSPEELPLAVAYAHDHGVRVHVTVNTMPRSGEVDASPPIWSA